MSTKFRAIANILEHTLPLIPQKLRTLLLSMLQHMKLDDVYALFTKPRALGYCLEKLDTRKFYGMTFHVPSNVEDYLKYHNGEKMEIPQKNYDWLDTPKWFTDFKGVARVSKIELPQLSDLLGRPPKRVLERG